jgi:hypothetical protein
LGRPDLVGPYLERERVVRAYLERSDVVGPHVERCRLVRRRLGIVRLTISPDVQRLGRHALGRLSGCPDVVVSHVGPCPSGS